MKADDVRHGTARGYRAHMEAGQRACNPCRQAHTEAAATRSRLIAYGRYVSPLVDAESARQHVRALMAQGMGLRSIAKTADCRPARLSYLLYGIGHGRVPAAQILREFSAALLAVEAAPTILPITGTRRRLEALVALGYTQQDLANRLATPKARVWMWLNKDQGVMRETHRRICNLYDELSMRPVPAGYGASRARAVAARKGYVPPLAWDDDEIDLPEAQPAGSKEPRRRRYIDESVVLRLLEGAQVDSTPAEKVIALRRWVAGGGSRREFCRIHGWQENRYKDEEGAA